MLIAKVPLPNLLLCTKSRSASSKAHECPVELSQVVDARGIGRMLGTKSAGGDPQALLVEHLGLGIGPHRDVHSSQVVHRHAVDQLLHMLHSFQALLRE